MTTATKTNSAMFSSLVDQGNKTIAEIREIQNTAVTSTARNVAFAGMALGGVALAGMLFLQIITGVVALAVSIGSVLGAVYGIRFLKQADPLIKEKMRNFVLKKRIEEAKTNKIETLTHMVLTSNDRLQHGRRAVDKMGGYVRKLKAKLMDSDKNSANYPKKVEMTEQVEKAYVIMQENNDKAAKAHKALETKVEEYKEMDEFTDIAQEAMRYAYESNDQELEKMLGFEAFSAIESDFHEAMASLENSARNYQIDNE